MQGEETSMEVDSGPAGLQNSQHARASGAPESRNPGPATIPATQIPATSPATTQILKRPTQQTPPFTKADEYDVFVALVKGGNLREAFNRVWAKARNFEKASARQPLAKPDEPITRKILQDVVYEAFKKLGPTTAGPQTKTWATVAANNGTTTHSSLANSGPTTLATKKPAHVRELVIRTGEMAPELLNRTPLQIVERVNTASSEGGLKAVRRLPSGAYTLVFETEAKAKWHRTNTEWVQASFGQNAEIQKKIFSVLAKGVPVSITSKEVAEVREDLQAQNRIKIHQVLLRRPRPGLDTTVAILQITDTNEANKLCDQGLLLDGQHFVCEPFTEALPTQCFKCWKFGHKAKFCPKQETTCGKCGTSAHTKEEPCPTDSGQARLRCPCCGGNHPAYSIDCPEKLRRIEKAKAAFQNRPRRFQAPTLTFSFPSSTLPSSTQERSRAGTQEDTDGFQPAEKKRKRGRPTTLSTASQSTNLYDFLPASAQFPTSQAIQPATQAIQPTTQAETQTQPQNQAETRPLSQAEAEAEARAENNLGQALHQMLEPPAKEKEPVNQWG